MICDKCMYDHVCYLSKVNDDDDRRALTFCADFCDAPSIVISELEKIKAEIEEIKILRINPYNNQSEYSVSTKELRELLDNHISEPKGEQE